MSSLVKNMVNMFENISSKSQEPGKLRKTYLTNSLDSIDSSFRKPKEHKPKTQIDIELLQLEQQTRHLRNTLKNYKTYNRENHIYYQNQIFFVLTDIVNIDAKDDPHVVNKKTELVEVLKRLVTNLNSLLPSGTKNSYIDLPPPVVKQAKNEKVKKVLPKQQTIEREEEELVVPSVKMLKQLWERNITETEKKKPRENGGVKVSKSFTITHLDTSRYVPYHERYRRENPEEISESIFKKSTSVDSLRNYEGSIFKQQNSVDSVDSLENYKGSVIQKTNSVDVPENPLYEESTEVKTFYEDDKPEKLTYSLLSQNVIENSDSDSDIQVNGDMDDS